jgi:alkylhydroperoxidase family enzyme
MEPMHLSGVEGSTQDHPLLKAAREARGGTASQILHLFAFKPQATRHLMRFTQEVMRGPSPLSPGWRELIAAFTSKLNRCPF